MSYSEAVARELRAELARRRLTQVALAERINADADRRLNQQWLHRRLSGAVPFDLDELALVVNATGADMDAILRAAGVLEGEGAVEVAQ